MNTVDPAGSADDIRWAVARDGRQDFAATRAADSAVVALGLAQQYLLAASAGIGRHAPEGEIVEQTNSADHAIRRMTQHLETVREASDPGGKAHAAAVRLLTAVQSGEFEAFSRLSNALNRGRSPAEKGWRESLPDLEHRLAGLRRSLHELARNVNAEDGSRLAQVNPELLNSVRRDSRLTRAAELVARPESFLPEKLREQVDVRIGAFEQQFRPMTDVQQLRPSHSVDRERGEDVQPVAGTDIAAVLEQIQQDRREQPIAAVFLLTDVAHNAAQADPRQAASTLADTPVYVVPIGNTQHVRDAILQSVYAPTVAMRNDDVVIEARVQAYDCEGEVCTVQLLQDGEVVDFREVLLDSGFAGRSVRFERHMPAVGKQTFQLAIVPLDGELSEENNYGEVEVSITSSDVKVLLSDNLPRWEYRYLAQLFRRDPKIECDELLFHPRVIATGRREASQAFPETVDDWDQYDVVMLGDIPTAELSQSAQESLIDYLKQRGGTLVMIAGREAMPHQFV
ncbi:MAG: hypothetical protein KDA89_24170, partial [Planctomycetaceae bacterium]|nr:hypothetical protein [Planctomycetaceae bacterium]